MAVSSPPVSTSVSTLDALLPGAGPQEEHGRRLVVATTAATFLLLGLVAAVVNAAAPAVPIVRTEAGGGFDLALIGGLLFLSAYNALVFLPTRQISYLIYGGMGAALALVYATYFDAGAALLGLADAPVLQQRLNHLASGTAIATALAFALTFLRVRERRPRLAWAGAGVSLGVATFTFTVLPFLAPWVQETVLALPGLFLPPVVLALGVDAWRQGFVASRYYLLAWTPLMAVVLPFTLELLTGAALGVSGQALLLANVLEMLAFALALTDRIKLTMDEREAVHTSAVRALEDELRDVRLLGPYTLGEKIGEGGMGVVYRARHALLRRPTAVKLIHPKRAGAHAIERFEREVRTTSRLTHPNTITVYDYGRTEDGILYYAMELLEGATLKDIVEVSGPQPPARVVHVLGMVVGALCEAHEIGLIHRDIKPGNVILSRQGGARDVAKVVDFGLVKELGQEALHPDLSTHAALAGTPLYMAPELLDDPPAYGPRSDIYAVGAVAWYLLTGTQLFSGGSVFEVLLRHLQDTPETPSSVRGEAIPEDLEALVLELLEKDPARRPADGAEVLSRLSACACWGEWTDGEARAWWGEHEEALRLRRRHQRVSANDASPGDWSTQLEVELEGRAE